MPIERVSYAHAGQRLLALQLEDRGQPLDLHDRAARSRSPRSRCATGCSTTPPSCSNARRPISKLRPGGVVGLKGVPLDGELQGDRDALAVPVAAGRSRRRTASSSTGPASIRSAPRSTSSRSPTSASTRSARTASRSTSTTAPARSRCAAPGARTTSAGRSTRRSCEGQIQGGFVQGMGYALTEAMHWNDEGWLTTATLADYKIPGVLDSPPEIHAIVLEDPDPTPSGRRQGHRRAVAGRRRARHRQRDPRRHRRARAHAADDSRTRARRTGRVRRMKLARLSAAGTALARPAQAYGAECWQQSEGIAGEEFAFGADPYQRLLVFARAKPDGRVLLFWHGGGWTSGYKEWMGFMAPAFNAAGVTFVSAGYRLAPQHVFPAALDDCAAALAWVVRTSRARRRSGQGLHRRAFGRRRITPRCSRSTSAGRAAELPRHRARLPCRCRACSSSARAPGLSCGRGSSAPTRGNDARASPRSQLATPLPPFLVAYGTQRFPAPDPAGAALRRGGARGRRRRGASGARRSARISPRALPVARPTGRGCPRRSRSWRGTRPRTERSKGTGSGGSPLHGNLADRPRIQSRPARRVLTRAGPRVE